MADGNTETPDYQTSFELPDLPNPEPDLTSQKTKTTKQQRGQLPHEQPETTAFQSAFDLTDRPPTPEIPEPKGETNSPETTTQTLQETELDTTLASVAENNQTQQKSEQGTTKKSVIEKPTYCGEGHGIMERGDNGFAWCKVCSYGPGSVRFKPKTQRKRGLLPFE